MILTLCTCTVSMACGHHTSSNGLKDTDTLDFKSLSLLVNQSQLDLLVKVSRHKHIEHKGGSGWSRQGALSADCFQ